MLSYNKFKDYLCRNIKEYLPIEYQDAKIEVNKYRKANQGEIEGIMIMPKDCDIMPTLPLNQLYERYCEGLSLEEIMKSITESMRKVMPIKTDSLALEKLTDWNYIKNKIGPRVVNKEKNESLLTQFPWRAVEGTDLIMLYDICLTSEAHALVQNGMLEKWAITEADLYDSAMTFLQNKQVMCREITGKILFMPDGKTDLVDINLTDVGSRILDEDCIYCLSNENNFFGAEILLNTKLLADLENRMHGDLVIFPATVHELVLAKYDERKSPVELQYMVLSGNRFLTQEEDFLSNNVYVYGNGKLRTITNEYTLACAKNILADIIDLEEEGEEGIEL